MSELPTTLYAIATRSLDNPEEWDVCNVGAEKPTERMWAGDEEYVVLELTTVSSFTLPPKPFGEIDGREICNGEQWDRESAKAAKRRRLAGEQPAEAEKKGWETL